MLKKITMEFMKDRKNKEREILERQAAGCVDYCILMCEGPGGNSYNDTTAMIQCASPAPEPEL